MSNVHSIPLDVSAAGDTVLVPAAAGCRIRVWAYNFIAGGTVDVKFADESSDRTGAYPLIAHTGLSAPAGRAPWFQTAVGEALRINLSAAVQVAGALVYELA